MKSVNIFASKCYHFGSWLLDGRLVLVRMAFTFQAVHWDGPSNSIYWVLHLGYQNQSRQEVFQIRKNGTFLQFFEIAYTWEEVDRPSQRNGYSLHPAGQLLLVFIFGNVSASMRVCVLAPVSRNWKYFVIHTKNPCLMWQANSQSRIALTVLSSLLLNRQRGSACTDWLADWAVSTYASVSSRSA